MAVTDSTPTKTPADSEGRVECRSFKSLEAFREFRTSSSHCTPRHIESIVEGVRRDGIFCNVHRERVPADRLRIVGTNYRETINHRGFTSRLRAVHHLVQRELGTAHPGDVRIYSPEAVTPYALYMRGKHARFLGSEYAPDRAAAAKLFPIPAEDLHQLSFHDGAFDLAVVNEVFEHVPFLDRVLAELARVLVPGGVLISTFPFLTHRNESVVKARLEAGEVVHLTEPEYHGNPVDPEAGSLVFEVPGWQILQRCRDAGFVDAEMWWVQSAACGILTPDHGGVMVLRARR